MSVFKKKNKNGTISYGYDFRDRATNTRHRKIVSLARTKWDAEQAEVKAKKDVFEKRYGVEEKGTDLLTDFLDQVFVLSMVNPDLIIPKGLRLNQWPWSPETHLPPGQKTQRGGSYNRDQNAYPLAHAQI